MRTIFRYIKIICFVVLIPTGLLGFIYDYVIWNKSILSDSANSFFDIMLIIGVIATGVLVITCAIEQIILRIKLKKLLKNK